MKRFGESWGAPICDPEEGVEHTATPVGKFCARCQLRIALGDQGLILPYYGDPTGVGESYWHIDCFTDSLGIRKVRQPEVM